MRLLTEGRTLESGCDRKQQIAVVTYLALHLVPGRLYSEAEVDWLICTRHARSAKVKASHAAFPALPCPFTPFHALL